VATLVVVVADEVPESRFQLLWEVVVLEPHHVLHDPVVALDLVVGLRVVRSAARVRHLAVAQVLTELARQIARVVIRK
jgi:hypothetical protein